MKKIAIFASGAGSNAQKIIEYFHKSNDNSAETENILPAEVALVVSNKPTAGVLWIAEKENIPSIIIDKERFFRGDGYVQELHEKGIDFIVLAGFLWKIPQALIEAYRNRIINIHPALLPKYGGKGMYGNFVHEAVVNAKEAESGITIHFVDEHYDNGDIIFQAQCPVHPFDTPEMLAERIHTLEHKHYPPIIEQLVKNL